MQLPLQNLNEGTSQTHDLGSKPDIDQALSRADWDIKKTGRLNISDVVAIVNQIKELSTKCLKHSFNCHRLMLSFLLSETVTSTQSLLLLRCCGSLVPEEPAASRTKLAGKIWKLFEQLKVSLDISHYNALLRVYLENEHSFDPKEFLATLKTKAIEPNRVQMFYVFSFILPFNKQFS